MPRPPERCLVFPASALLLTALIGWCAGSGCTARLEGPGAGPAAPVTEGSDCLDTYLAVVRERLMVEGVAGSGRVQFVSDSGRGRASFDFVFHRPDILRLQFHSPLGPVAAVLDLQRGRYLFADFREGVFVEGPAGEADLFRLTGLPAPPRTLLSLLLAEPVPDDGGVSRVRFHPQSCLPVFCELENLVGQQLPVEVVYRWPGPISDGEHGAGVLTLPGKVVFTGPEPGSKTTIRFKRVRPLTGDECSGMPEPIDTSGLCLVIPDETTEDHLPRWIGQGISP